MEGSKTKREYQKYLTQVSLANQASDTLRIELRKIRSEYQSLLRLYEQLQTNFNILSSVKMTELTQGLYEEMCKRKEEADMSRVSKRNKRRTVSE